MSFYDSFATEAVLVFFMTVSGFSFSVYYLLYARRRFDVVLDRELLVYLAIIVGAVLFEWGSWSLRGTTRTLGARH